LADTLWINAHKEFPAASTMKLAVLVELARSVDTGQRRWDGTTRLHNRFSGVDGARVSTTRRFDPDRELHNRIGQPVTYAELGRRMTARSSNLATNVLLEELGPDAVDGVEPQLRVRALLADTEAQARGIRNTATAAALARLLARIESGAAASPVQTDSMRAFLRAQVFRNGIPKGVPAAARVANKTGETSSVFHDAAIVYPPLGPPYVLVVLTQGLNPERAKRLVAEISAAAYRHLASAPSP
jgi:beta-lactamase class A